jgi:carbonic anhydrase/acetyltransferase-like protein (isoleucine patch superfamily)
MLSKHPLTDPRDWLFKAYADPASVFPAMIASPGYALPPIAGAVWHLASAGLSVGGASAHHWGKNQNNWIVVPADGSARGDLKVIYIGEASNNILVLGPNTDMHGQVFFHGDGGLVIVGGDMDQRCEMTTRLWSQDNILFWGRRSTSNSVTITLEGDATAVVLGEDCMLARDVAIRTSDEHALVDLRDGGWLNPPGTVHVEPHVWLGDKSTLLKGVHIGFGSVVGGSSVVTRSVPRFSVAAGVPARVLRSGVSWSRQHSPEAGIADVLRQHESSLTGAAPRAGVRTDDSPPHPALTIDDEISELLGQV